MKKWVLATAGSVVAVGLVGGGIGYAVNAGHAQDENRAKVTRIIDGDTFEAEVMGTDTTIRMLNIDTPETKHPDKPVECYGPEATELLKSLLEPGDVVRLDYDQERLDKYDRTLAGVYKDDDLINAEIARQGLGLAVKFEPNVKFYNEVLKAEGEARAAERGIFSADPEHLADDGQACALQVLAEEPVAQGTEALEQVAGETASETQSAVGDVVAAIAALESVRSLVGDDSDVRRTLLRRVDNGMTVKSVDDLIAGLERKRADLQETVERQTSQEQAERRRLAAEKKAAEKKAAEKKAAEQAQKKAADRQRAAAERAAQAERDRAQQKPAPKPQPQRKPAPKPKPKPQPQQQSGQWYPRSGGPAGYNGPRCFAPGGQSWRPC
ncbi:MAG: thermonuclease family protein [Galactobacter sp.]